MRNFEITKKIRRSVVKGIVLLTVIFAGCASDTMVSQPDSGSETPAPVVQAEPVPDLTETTLQSRQITGISIYDDEGVIQVLVQGDSQLTYTSRKQSLPLALVLYFPETSLAATETEILADSDIVDLVKASELIEGGPTKIEITLKKDMLHKISTGRDGLTIAFSKSPDGFPEETEDAAARFLLYL